MSTARRSTSLAKAVRPKKPVAKIALELSHRARLIELLNDPVMQAALANVLLQKPGVFFGGSATEAHKAGDVGMATLLANNRLHQIQGWELFEAALFAQANDPRPPRAPVNETYPTEIR